MGNSRGAGGAAQRAHWRGRAGQAAARVLSSLAERPLDRRAFLKLLARTTGLLAASSLGLGRQRARALTTSTLATRSVAGADASALQTIMTSSVRDTSAFFGKCGEWSLAWASDLVARCPDTVLLAKGSTAIAFLEIPPILSPLPALSPRATKTEREQHALRTRNRTTFRVTAAGVRDDLFSTDGSVRVFRKVLYAGFVRARQLGYTTVEAVAPWEQHPRMTRKWTDYPGCELVEPVSRAQEGGKDLYWLRWHLDEAIAALATEGASDDQLDDLS